jgi:hypothetical protein
MPAEVITHTRHRQPLEHAAPRAEMHGFLPHPRHQEDVVVNAQRDKEDEAVQWEGRILIREMEDLIEDDDTDAE